MLVAPALQVNFKPGNTAVVGGSELELVQYHFHTPSEHTFDGVHTPLEVHLSRITLARSLFLPSSALSSVPSFHLPCPGILIPDPSMRVHRVMGTASLAVVGVLLERGAKEPNPAVQLALDAAPRQSNVKVQVRPRSPAVSLAFRSVAGWQAQAHRTEMLSIDWRSLGCAPRSLSPMALLPEPKNDHRPYFHYIGSLTTPPCSEGIDCLWAREQATTLTPALLSPPTTVSWSSSCEPEQAAGDRQMLATKDKII
eukprot:931508-Pelagomonas_calceolata.AAC.1